MSEIEKHRQSAAEDESVWEEIPEIVQPIYKIDERPGKWYECVLYGWQHTLVDISPLVLPLILGGALGMSGAECGRFVNFCLFSMGIATLLQTTIGNRLPIIQGPSAALTEAMKSVGHAPSMWGAVVVGAMVEMAIGASRILKHLRKFFPMTVCGVVVVSIGISLGQVGIGKFVISSRPEPVNLALAATVILLIMVLQIGFAGRWGGVVSRGAIFFSIWIVGLGLGGLLGKVSWNEVTDKEWFAMPMLFPYGGPWLGWELAGAAVLGILAGFLGSIMESIGDYAAVCAVSGEPYQVKHMNRGIFAEGLGCFVAALFGGIPCTSYTQNIGVIATTRIASRTVVRIAAVILVLYGLCPKFGALLVAMPRAVVGGVFVVVCGMIVTSGIRLLHAVKPTAANSLIIGTTLIVAIGVPNFMAGKPWLAALPALVKLLCQSTVVLAVCTGIALNLLLNVALPALLKNRGDSGGEGGSWN